MAHKLGAAHHVPHGIANPRYPLISELTQMYINVFDKAEVIKEAAVTKEKKKTNN